MPVLPSAGGVASHSFIHLFFHSCFTPYIHCGSDVDWRQSQLTSGSDPEASLRGDSANRYTAVPIQKPNKDVLYSEDVHASSDDFCFFTFVQTEPEGEGTRPSF